MPAVWCSHRLLRGVAVCHLWQWYSGVPSSWDAMPRIYIYICRKSGEMLELQKNDRGFCCYLWMKCSDPDANRPQQWFIPLPSKREEFSLFPASPVTVCRKCCRHCGNWGFTLSGFCFVLMKDSLVTCWGWKTCLCIQANFKISQNCLKVYFSAIEHKNIILLACLHENIKNNLLSYSVKLTNIIRLLRLISLTKELQCWALTWYCCKSIKNSLG